MSLIFEVYEKHLCDGQSPVIVKSTDPKDLNCLSSKHSSTTYCYVTLSELFKYTVPLLLYQWKYLSQMD